MVRSHHRLNGHESEQTQRDGEGQGRLACCSPWGCRVGHDLATEQHNNKKENNGSEKSWKHMTNTTWSNNNNNQYY